MINSFEDIQNAHMCIKNNATAQARVNELLRQNENLTWGDAIVQAYEESVRPEARP